MNVIIEKRSIQQEAEKKYDLNELEEKIKSLLIQDDLSMLEDEESPLSNFMLYKELPHYLPKLLQKKANPNLKPEFWSPLILAILHNQLGCVLHLLQAGAHPNGAQNRKNFPLIEAIHEGNKEIVQALLEYGANPNVIMKKPKYTPLMSAICSGRNVEALQKNRSAIIDLLLRFGADSLVRNKKKMTVFSVMKQYVVGNYEYANPAKQNSLEYKKIGNALIRCSVIRRILGKKVIGQHNVQLPQPIINQIIKYVDFGLVPTV